MRSTPRVVIPHLASHTRKGLERRAYKPQFRQKRKRSRSPAGPRRLGTATRISASLSRRLSAFFGSTHDQDPKAAKFAVLNPGHAGFPKRVERSESSDTTPIRNAPCFAVWAVVCDLSPKAECVPAFGCESKHGAFVREVEKRNEKRFGTALRRQLFGDIRGNGFGRKAELFRKVFRVVKAVRF